jgi:hypothetical protein
MTARTSRADLHCHLTASQLSKLGVQRALKFPEWATAMMAWRHRWDKVLRAEGEALRDLVSA